MEKKNQKEKHATKVTKIPTTKRRKNGMKETLTDNEESIIIYFLGRYKTLSK